MFLPSRKKNICILRRFKSLFALNLDECMVKVKLFGSKQNKLSTRIQTKYLLLSYWNIWSINNNHIFQSFVHLRTTLTTLFITQTFSKWFSYVGEITSVFRCKLQLKPFWENSSCCLIGQFWKCLCGLASNFEKLVALSQ